MIPIIGCSLDFLWAACKDDSFNHLVVACDVDENYCIFLPMQKLARFGGVIWHPKMTR